ncbi:ATP-binding protein [Myceligenerans halotolerans]
MERTIIPRRAKDLLADRMQAFRVTVVGGPRQAGKTTLLRALHAARGGRFVTLDDPTALATARDDPAGFVEFGDAPHIIDEVQRGGDPMLLAIKAMTDRSDAPGQFVLSGSTRFLTVPTLSESLAGRAVFVDLWPLSAAERTRSGADVGRDLFLPDELTRRPLATEWTRQHYAESIAAGGYPEAVRLPGQFRDDWFESYLSTVVLRDVAGFADVRHADVVPQLLRLVAARSGTGVVVADLARAVGLAQPTVRDYLGYLDVVYLTARLPVWSNNLTTRLTKTPKVYVTDSGLTASLLGVDATALAVPGHPQAGAMVESFVFTELVRQLSTSSVRAELSYYRDREGREIDFVLERRDGSLVGIEVKAGSTVRSDSFKHLAWLRDKVGDRFVAGYVLYLGPEPQPFGDRLAALPLSALWEGRPVSAP